MFEILAYVGSLEVITLLLGLLLFISVFVRRNSLQEVQSLRRENYRLKNILASMMINNTQINGMK